MPLENRAAIMQSLTERFAFLFEQLAIANTTHLLERFVQPVAIEKSLADFADGSAEPVSDVIGLSD